MLGYAAWTLFDHPRLFGLGPEFMFMEAPARVGQSPRSESKDTSPASRNAASHGSPALVSTTRLFWKTSATHVFIPGAAYRIPSSPWVRGGCGWWSNLAVPTGPKLRNPSHAEGCSAPTKYIRKRSAPAGRTLTSGGSRRRRSSGFGGEGSFGTPEVRKVRGPMGSQPAESHPKAASRAAKLGHPRRRGRGRGSGL